MRQSDGERWGRLILPQWGQRERCPSFALRASFFAKATKDVTEGALRAELMVVEEVSRKNGGGAGLRKTRKARKGLNFEPLIGHS